MIKKLMLTAALAALAVGAAFGAWPCAAENTTTYKIDAAVKAGSLTTDEALMYKFMALYPAYEGQVPAAFRGEWYGPEEWNCGTPVVMDIWQRWPKMDPGVKEKLQKICGLGQSQSNLFTNYRGCSWGNSQYGGVTVYTFDTPQGSFKVHYVKEGPNAIQDETDEDADGVPDTIEFIGNDLETAFAQYKADNWYKTPDAESQKYLPLKDKYPQFNWPAPGTDDGGDARTDAYLGALTGGVGGIAYAQYPFEETYREDYAGYMNFRNTYTPVSGGSFNEPVITAHEFMHVTEFMINVTTPSWYLESTAMWAEDTVYPNAPDPRGRMNSYLGNTLQSLDMTTDGGYIACIINFFYRDWCWRNWVPPDWKPVTGYLVPREMWHAMAKGDEWYTEDPNTNRDPWTAFDYVIRYHHQSHHYVPGRAFPEAFELWTTWNWFTGNRDDEKHYRWDYNAVGLQNQWHSGEYPIVKFTPAEAYLMNHLGHGFYWFDGLPSWVGAIFTFEGDPANADASKDWGGQIMVTKDGNTWTDLHDVQGQPTPMFSPKDTGILQVPNPSQYQAIVMILSNTSTSGSKLVFDYSVLNTSDTTPPNVTAGVVRPEAIPDYVELLLGSDESLFGAAEAGVFFTPTGGEERADLVNMAGQGGGETFIGTFVMQPGENGSGRFEWKCSDTSGNIVSGTKPFDAGFLTAGGGTVGGESASLHLNAGTIGGMTLFSIVPKDAPATVAAGGLGQGQLTVGPVYDYAPSWAHLAKPVEIGLSYEGLEVTNEKRLSVFRRVGGGWEDLGGTIDHRNHRVVAMADRLGEFTLGYGDPKSGGPAGGRPMAFSLCQSYPNPALNATTIKFTLPSRTAVEMAVYDLTGRRVATVYRGVKDAGVNEIKYNLVADDGRALPAGVYLYRLTAGTDVATKKMVVAR